jgi:hypothetical protein
MTDDELPEPMTSVECKRIVHGSCHRKQQYDNLNRAERAAAKLRTASHLVAGYRCPFAGPAGDPPHWHVGRPPSVETVERIALAIRWLHDHPEDAARGPYALGDATQTG